MSRLSPFLGLCAFLILCHPLPATMAADNTTSDPTLFFKKSDVAGLKEKILDPTYAPMWKDMLEKVHAYCDPQSHDFADPGLYQKALTTEYLAGMKYSRDLSVWTDALGFAYQMTGDAEIGKHGVALLESAARNLTVHSKPMAEDNSPPYGDIMRAYALGLDMLSGAMTPDQRKVIAGAARDYILQHIKDYNTAGGPWTTWRYPHNFTGVTGGALGLLAIALRNDYPEEVPAWLKLAQKMCDDWLKAGFDRQGSYFEGVLYMSYGLGNLVMFSDALDRYHGDKSLITNLREKGIPLYLAMTRLPGEPSYDARNDSLYALDLSGGAGIGSPFLLLMATGFRGATTPDPLAGWLWNNTAPKKFNKFLQIVWGDKFAVKEPSQVLPTPYGTYFADQGLCFWKTGWKKEDVMFSIEAGPYHWITHDQADKGHFNLYGLGYKWAVDPGYGNNQEPEGRCETVSHSCVLVDGKGQALSGASLGTDGKVLRHENTARFGYALIDAKSAYNTNNKGQPGVPLTKALRHVFFFRPSETAPRVPAYAVVLDDIEWDQHPHDFTWQMIAWQDMAIQTVGEDAFILKPPGDKETDPQMKVLLKASAPLQLSAEPFKPDDHPGRLPNDYQRLRAVAKARNPYFAAVLAPLPAGVNAPNLVVDETASGRVVKVVWENRTDTIEWYQDEAKLKP